LGKKQAKTKGGVPASGKQPRAEEPKEFFDLRPAWRIGRMAMCDPFGWHELDKSKINQIHSRLAQLENLTWKEVLIQNNHWNHTIPIGSLSKDARARLTSLRLDDLDEVISIRLTHDERIWGFKFDGALTLLWYDPTHDVWAD
jgi:hypothetical protein